MARKLIALIFSLLIIAVPVFRVYADEYTYTVTVYAGNQGQFTEDTPSPSSYTIEGEGYGDLVMVDWNDHGFKLKDPDKYYVLGFKVAGHDYDEDKEDPDFNPITAGSFYIKEDTDLVIAYGVRDEGMVSYTVRFLEEKTEKVLASETSYEGRVGDRPIVSHKFIEGYLPDALNRTKELTSNEADNVFTFYYHAVDYTNTVYETLYGPGTYTGGGGGGGTPSGGETTPEEGSEPTPTPAPSGGGEEMPPEIIDDDNPPLAPGGDDNTPSGNSRVLAYVAGAVGVAAVATGIILFARKKRDDDEEEEE